MEYPIELFKGGESRKIENSGQEAVARAQGYTEPYKFQEYPKQLYKNGTREVNEITGEQISADTRVARNKAEEDAARALGYRMLYEPAPLEEAKNDAQDDASAEDDAKGKVKGKKAA